MFVAVVAGYFAVKYWVKELRTDLINLEESHKELRMDFTAHTAPITHPSRDQIEHITKDITLLRGDLKDYRAADDVAHERIDVKLDNLLEKVSSK